ncbi:12863_t:CDS:2 [Dentiscutata heterogama]|uniref:12863_t:CDS:1 n=1 Tax=Dentiscutata heterogama TaxID=1316150 RepID=A0ACA9LE30_9GLOM|nr:12863_t:CDS:2 [Dentiscutata heterogama]
MKISFIVLLCIALFVSTFVLALPAPQSTQGSSSSSGKRPSRPKPSLTPSTSQGEASQPESQINVTAPTLNQCFKPNSDITVRWTTSLTDDKLLIKILSYDNPSFSLGLDHNNVVAASAGQFTIKTTADWPIGSYTAMVQLESNEEVYGASERFNICNSTTQSTKKTSDS